MRLSNKTSHEIHQRQKSANRLDSNANELEVPWSDTSTKRAEPPVLNKG